MEASKLKDGSSNQEVRGPTAGETSSLPFNVVPTEGQVNAVPRGGFAAALEQKLEPLTVNLLLPLFFVYSGLNTRINLLNTPALWLITLQLLAVAILGKGVACYAAARLNGEPPREAAAIGALMNARGLMELIILNIGRDFGVITDTLFSMMVIMAIVTTLMATPIFNAVYRRSLSPTPSPGPPGRRFREFRSPSS